MARTAAALGLGLLVTPVQQHEPSLPSTVVGRIACHVRDPEAAENSVP